MAQASAAQPIPMDKMAAQIATKVSTDVGVTTSASIAVGLGSLALLGGLFAAALGTGIQSSAEQSVQDFRIATTGSMSTNLTHQFQIVGTADTLYTNNSSSTGSVEVAGNYMYVLGEQFTTPQKFALEIYDISSRSNPKLVSTTPLTFPGSQSMVAKGNIVLLATVSGTQVIDVTSKTNPVVKGVVNTGFTRGVKINGNYAYVRGNDSTTGASTLYVLDLSNESNVSIIGSYVPSSNRFTSSDQIDVQGNFVYTSTINNGATLEIVDVSSPATPRLVGSFTFTPPPERLNEIFSIAAQGGTVYVAEVTTDLEHSNWSTLIRAINVSSPANPQLVATYDFSATASLVAVKDTSTLVVNLVGVDSSSINAFDATNPSNLTLKATYSLVDSITTIRKENNGFLYGNRWNGLELPISHLLIMQLVTLDILPPTVSITAPGQNVTVSGSDVTISATASDNIGVVGVQFYVDNAKYKAEVTTAPYRIGWNTTALSNGAHSLTAEARDAAGNKKRSSVIIANVQNSTPRIGFTRTDFSLKQRVSHRLWLNFALIPGEVISAQPVPGYSACFSTALATSGEPTCAPGIYPKSGVNDCRYYLQLSNWTLVSGKQTARCVIKVDYKQAGVLKSKYFESFITGPGQDAPGLKNQEYVCETGAPVVTGRVCIPH